MITIKRGDTLSFILRRIDEEGEPQIGIASKLKSQIRNRKDVLITEFIITETTDLGDYLFVVPANITSSLDVGTYYFDVEYTDNDIVSSSKTEEIQVVKDITRDD